jgi:hypothetical protein
LVAAPERAAPKLRRDVGSLGLLFVSLGSIIGAGWLFGALFASSLAGPAAVISWVLGGGAVMLLALTHAELGGMYPVAGGSARFPRFAFGKLIGFTSGWVAFLGAVTVGPIMVRLIEDASLKSGEMQVSLANEAEAVPSTAPSPSVLRSYPAQQQTQRITSAELDHTVLLPSTRATELEIVAGEGSGRVLPLIDPLTIGRGSNCTLSLSQPEVSRMHAEISWQDESWVIRDLGSTNGTLLNDHRITTHALRPTDKIKIGATEIVVR